jgi:predicted phage-related endonuclease
MKLREIEAQQKALEEQAEQIRREIKADMEEKQVDEMQAGSFIIRWKTILSSKLDGKALKAALPEIYGQYCKASASRRFTIV